jgi:uncharacterized membrane protein
VNDFYLGRLDQAQVLRDYAVTYIIVGPRERKLGVFDAAQLPLEEVFSSGDVVVYRVKRNA